jgi:hypothetical protein
MKKSLRLLAWTVVCLGLVAGTGPRSLLFGQDVLQKSSAVPKLIGEADLDCSLFLMGSPPNIRISAPYISGEKMLLADSDLFYADPAPGVEGIHPGSLWSILEWGSAVKGGPQAGVLGHVVFLRGRARVVRIESGRAVMQIEKSCGLIQTGHFLVPYQKGEILVGKEQEYRVPFRSDGGPTGQIVFMEREAMQLTARGHWAVVDIGEDQGLKIGGQLTVFHRERKEPPVAIANAVVVWMGPQWATIKILDSDDAVRLGDAVQTKPKVRP